MNCPYKFRHHLLLESLVCKVLLNQFKCLSGPPVLLTPNNLAHQLKSLDDPKSMLLDEECAFVLRPPVAEHPLLELGMILIECLLPKQAYKILHQFAALIFLAGCAVS
jgi:hypothetical protein